MKEYDVKITETLEKTVTVQAESHDAAEEQVRAAYYNSEYILDSENFTGVAFGTTEEREVQKEQADTMNVLLVKPFMYPQAVQIGCELEDLQKAVGGDAPIPLSTFGNRGQSNIGQNYLRSLFAIGFQGFLIMICVGIYAVLIQSIAFSDDIIGSIWGVMGYTVLLCFTLFKTGSLAKGVFSAH